ncbi:uncharacterized protein F4817DRAFT_315388 [Daldinia loculata]|uniref:uncharacterized protein n=1 Tax=Daldinia loculata TaxID=103429 RepID=UPI0020C54965|nr:uncharacterized protein F4817DRAFT_315388 [Daldinia loculata]KAI1647848.1 hypothetical protein F4817DRAFT_315388 [Daldinia loculata]
MASTVEMVHESLLSVITNVLRKCGASDTILYTPEPLLGCIIEIGVLLEDERKWFPLCNRLRWPLGNAPEVVRISRPTAGGMTVQMDISRRLVKPATSPSAHGPFPLSSPNRVQTVRLRPYAIGDIIEVPPSAYQTLAWYIQWSLRLNPSDLSDAVFWLEDYANSTKKKNTLTIGECQIRWPLPYSDNILFLKVSKCLGKLVETSLRQNLRHIVNSWYSPLWKQCDLTNVSIVSHDSVNTWPIIFYFDHPLFFARAPFQSPSFFPWFANRTLYDQVHISELPIASKKFCHVVLFKKIPSRLDVQELLVGTRTFYSLPYSAEAIVTEPSYHSTGSIFGGTGKFIDEICRQELGPLVRQALQRGPRLCGQLNHETVLVQQPPGDVWPDSQYSIAAQERFELF